MADVADLNSMYAYAVEAIYRMDEQLGAELDGDSHHLSVIRWHQNRSQYAPLQDGILIRKTAASLKHVVAHEVGHWFARAWGIDFVSTLAEAYNYPAQDASCVPSGVVFGGESHALRSSEFSADALEEGLAQFVATVAFNSHQSPSAYFQYYKVITDTEYLGHDLVELPGFLDDDSLGGTTRWVDEKCPNDWDFPYTGSPTGTEVTSEIDWMRFFWAFFTDSDNAPKPNLEDIFDLLAYATWDVGDVWGPLVDAVENHPSGQVSEHADRFEALNEDFGVYNDGS
jgi:hypothetical protein